MTYEFTSQVGEDRFIIEKVFPKLTEEQKAGMVIEIGANDGRTLSNTFAISNTHENPRYLVDASPAAFEIWPRRRLPWDTFVNKAVISNDDPSEAIILYQSGKHSGVPDKFNQGLVSTVLPDQKKRWRNTELFTKVIVPTITVEKLQADILEYADERGVSGKNPLLLSVDVEGMDSLILAEWNFYLIRPKLVICEHASDQIEAGKIMEIMSASRYKLIHQNTENFIFKDEN